MSDRFKRALEMLDAFERRSGLKEADATAFLAEIFRACGHRVKEQGFIGEDRRADCFIETDIAGKPQRILAEVNWLPEPTGPDSVRQAISFAEDGPGVDRSMVIARSGFTPAALALAESEGLGKIDLLAPPDIRNWLLKFEPGERDEPKSAAIIRCFLVALTEAVAENPEELWRLEWRMVEQMLGVVFGGLGFDVTVTRPGKDGGYDLELRGRESGPPETYLVEVKHWSHQKLGAAHLSKLVKVTASRKASGALLLSSSGFTSTIYSGIAEVTAPVRLGDGGKIVSLCKAYCRFKSGLWLDALDAKATLFTGTMPIGEHLQ
jgi:hypothetical protein